MQNIPTTQSQHLLLLPWPQQPTSTTTPTRRSGLLIWFLLARFFHPVAPRRRQICLSVNLGQISALVIIHMYLRGVLPFGAPQSHRFRMQQLESVFEWCCCYLANSNAQAAGSAAAAKNEEFKLETQTGSTSVCFCM